MKTRGRLPIYVLADDLTGAAELAAIAHQTGLRAVVHTTFPVGRSDGDVVVINTESRLLSSRRAARQVGAIARRVAARPHGGIFKKTDSVLRGHVVAELNACMAALGLPRTLLVPCNPSLGRVIRDGRYFLGGRPLHKTAFARDPHHPRRTADVVRLLTAESEPAQVTRSRTSHRARPGTVACCAPNGRLPGSGVVVGEADTPADVVYWAGQSDSNTLPAGGADFFRAWLTATVGRGANTVQQPLPGGNVLLLSGTSTPPDPVTPLPGVVIAVSARTVPPLATVLGRTRRILEREHCATVALRGSLAQDKRLPVALTRLLTRLGRALHRARAFEHLLIAGGATASGTLDALGWTKLEVVRVWGAGTVTLRPDGDSRFTVTLKPGSYPWPMSLSQHFDEALGVLETAAR